jgi:predicted acetyltransferase
MQAEYLPDSTVDPQTDEALRRLLSICFTKKKDAVFKKQRYFREPYPHRWVIRDDQGRIVAHTGVHEKQVIAGRRRFPIGGVCEVCVHPDYRRRGYVKRMLKMAHMYLVQHGFAFAVLFGKPEIYAAAGYRQVGNLFHGSKADGWKNRTAMVREIGDFPWPQDPVYLPGPTF